MLCHPIGTASTVESSAHFARIDASSGNPTAAGPFHAILAGHRQASVSDACKDRLEDGNRGAHRRICIGVGGVAVAAPSALHSAVSSNRSGAQTCRADQQTRGILSSPRLWSQWSARDPLAALQTLGCFLNATAAHSRSSSRGHS